jgi:hypothetical protein
MDAKNGYGNRVIFQESSVGEKWIHAYRTGSVHLLSNMVVSTESPRIFLPEERSRYPEHIFHTPFDQPDSLAQMVLYLCRLKA